MSAAAVIHREYRELFPKLVRDDPRSAKELARDVEHIVTPRQIENIREDESGASVPTFFLIARQIPELKAMALRWLEAAEQCDPDAERMANDMLRMALDLVRRRQTRLEQQARASKGEGDAS